MWAKNFQMYKLGLEKAEEPEFKLPTFIGSSRKQGNSQKTSTSASLTTLKPLPLWITANHGKFLKWWEYQIILHIYWETWMQIKKKQNWTWDNGLVQNSKRSMLRLYIVTLLIWRVNHANYRLDDPQAKIKIAGRNIYNLRYADDTTPRAASEEETEEPLHEGERGEWKSWLKTQHLKKLRT